MGRDNLKYLHYVIRIDKMISSCVGMQALFHALFFSELMNYCYKVVKYLTPSGGICVSIFCRIHIYIHMTSTTLYV